MATTKKAAKKSTTRKATATKSRTATKKTTAKKATASKTDVTFTDDIPKVTRDGGGTRGSKYDDLLDMLVKRHDEGKTATARMAFDTVGSSTSRYQSIKTAIEKREDAHLFDVAQRNESTEDEEVRAVYVKYDPEAEEPEVEEEEEEEEDDLIEDDDEDDDLDF